MKDITEIQEKALKLLKKGKLRKASQFFCSELMKINHQYTNKTILLQAQLSHLRKDKKAKIITDATYIAHRNRIMIALMNLIETVEEPKVKIITEY